MSITTKNFPDFLNNLRSVTNGKSFNNLTFYGTSFASSVTTYLSAKEFGNEERKAAASVYALSNSIGFLGALFPGKKTVIGASLSSFALNSIGYFFAVNCVGKDKKFNKKNHGERNLIFDIAKNIIVGMSGVLQFISVSSLISGKYRNYVNKIVPLAFIPGNIMIFADGIVNKDKFYTLSGLIGMLAIPFAGKLRHM